MKPGNNVIVKVGGWLRWRKTTQKQPKDVIKETNLFWYTDWRPDLVGQVAVVEDVDEEFASVRIADQVYKLDHTQYEPEKTKKVRNSNSEVQKSTGRDI